MTVPVPDDATAGANGSTAVLATADEKLGPQFTAAPLVLTNVTLPLAAAAAAACALATRASAEQRQTCCSCEAVVAAVAF